jgi:hypothetical protein
VQHPFHKRHCREIACLREECRAQGEIDCLLSNNMSAPSCKEQLADAIFLEGYRSSDTMDRAASMYVSAVTEYMDLRRLRCFDNKNVIKPAILLVAIGCDEMAYSLLMDHMYFWGVDIPAGHRPGDWFLPLKSRSDAIDLDKLAEADPFDSFTGVVKLIILLLIKLRLISNGTVTFFQATDAGSGLQESAVSAIAEFVRGDDAYQRRQHVHIQDLLRHPNVRGLANMVRDCHLLCKDLSEDECPSACLPDEIFHLLQDCFFLTPGVSDLLQEVLPDETAERD